ncbi:MAG: hypothetical protein V1888_03545 [archaeon]
MRNKRFGLLVVIVAIVIVIFFVVGFILSDNVVKPRECVDVSATAGFVYDVCYDSYTQNIFMLVKGKSDYYLDTFRVSFFDGRDRSYDLGYSVDDVSQLYKFYAARNPSTINLDLNVFGVVDSACNGSRALPVRYCITRRPADGKGSLNGSEVEDYISVSPSPGEEYPENGSYSEKEIAWMDVCWSDWRCSEWEMCDGELQRRDCEDLNGCIIPIGSPDTVRYCGEECVEDWDCEWSDCVNGFMQPICRDLGNCGTEYDKPGVMSCSTESACRPDIFCEKWSECVVDYGLLDLVGKDIGGLVGVRSRVCMDKNGCVESRKEVEDCSIGVDIYVERFSKCGEDFIGIYNRLNDNLIARIREGADGEPAVDIYFDDRGSESYCDYCYDGILDADEEGIDCGGSCMSCEDKYKIRAFKRSSWFGNFINWLRELF